MNTSIPACSAKKIVKMEKNATSFRGINDHVCISMNTIPPKHPKYSQDMKATSSSSMGLKDHKSRNKIQENDIDPDNIDACCVNETGVHIFMVIACIFLSIGSSVGVVIVNRFLTEKFEFHYETTLIGLHQFVISFICYALSFWQSEPLFVTKHIPFKDALHVALSYTLGIVFVDLSMNHISLATYQFSKLMVAPIVLLLHFILHRAIVPLRVFLAMLLILLGVFAVQISDVNLESWQGYLYSALGILFTAFSHIVISEKHKQLNATSFQMLFYQAPLSSIILFCLAPFVEGWTWKHNIFTFHYTPRIIGIIVISCITAFGTTFGTFLVIGYTSPLTYEILGNVKTVLILLIGLYIFEQVPNINIHIRYLGFLLSLLGVIWYTYEKTDRKVWKTIFTSNYYLRKYMS